MLFRFGVLHARPWPWPKTQRSAAGAAAEAALRRAIYISMYVCMYVYIYIYVRICYTSAYITCTDYMRRRCSVPPRSLSAWPPLSSPVSSDGLQVRISLGWLETKMAQNTLNYMSEAYLTCDMLCCDVQ